MNDDTKRQGGEQDFPAKLRELAKWMLAEDIDMQAPPDTVDPEEAAEAFEALQQRCGELEAKCKRAWGTANRVLDNNPDQKDRIAALEGALRRAAERFYAYERMHLEKAANCTQGSTLWERAMRKARLNADMGAEMEAALAPGGDGGEGRDFSGWLPESEAPRDGTPVILAHFDDDTLSIPIWFVMGTAWNLVDAWKGWDDYFAYPPTHYQPLIFPRPHPTEPDQPDVCDVCERPAHWTEICTNPLCPNEKVRASDPERPEGECPHWCRDGWITRPDEFGRAQRGPCPIHGTPQGKEGE